MGLADNEARSAQLSSLSTTSCKKVLYHVSALHTSFSLIIARIPSVKTSQCIKQFKRSGQFIPSGWPSICKEYLSYFHFN